MWAHREAEARSDRAPDRCQIDAAWTAPHRLAEVADLSVDAVEGNPDLPVVCDVDVLRDAGFTSAAHQWSVNFKGRSQVSLRLSTESFYEGFTERRVAADVHGILMRVASLEDTLRGKIKAWGTPERRQSKRIKDLADIARLVEAHPHLWAMLPDQLRSEIEEPPAE